MAAKWKPENREQLDKRNARQRKRWANDPSVRQRAADGHLRRAKLPFHKKDQQLRYEFGITWKDYSAMFNLQDGACAICRTRTPGGGRVNFNVDHCHDTGKIRGLL